jgi:hypothetical protein
MTLYHQRGLLNFLVGHGYFQLIVTITRIDATFGRLE